MLDFVYIVKEDEYNEDLRYSLRSIAKYYPENKVWIVGYKPSWVKNVNYLPIEQSGDKWKNSINNILAACHCSDISDNFILMNDDFFMIKPLVPIEMIGNASLGILSTNIAKKYKNMSSSWYRAFEYVRDLLKELNIPEPYYDYEVHLPLEINKKKFIEVMNLPEVQEFMQTSKILHKRTLYKNYDKKEGICLPADVKVEKTLDDSEKRVNICGWLSVYDNQLGSSKFYRLTHLLQDNLSQNCIYEKDTITQEEKLSLKNIQIDPDTVNIPSIYIEPVKKKDFIKF